MTITKNIVTDYGAVVGSGDDGQAFVDFRTFAQAQNEPIVLTIPAGTYDTYPGPPTGRAFADIDDLTVEATGAVLDYMWFGGQGIRESPDFSARVATVVKGAMAVTLLTPADHARFTVGGWVLLTALDLQGAPSVPVNPYYFEYNQITAINTETGVLDLATPATQHYRASFPLYSPGGGGFGDALDMGGPATLYALPAEWDGVLAINGLTVTLVEEAGIYGALREIHLTDCVFDGTYSPAPGSTQHYRFTRCHFACGNGSIEVDKISSLLEFIDCTATDGLLFQSSNERVVIDGSTFSAGIAGTPKHLTIRGGSVVAGLVFGPTGYGVAESVTIEDSTIGGQGLVYGPGRRVALADYTYSDGVFRIAHGGGPVSWAVPGCVMFYTDDAGRNYGTAFTVLDVTESGADTVIHTTAPATLPSIISGANTHLAPHPCIDCTIVNSTGAVSVVDHATYARKHRPAFEHALRTLTTPIDEAFVGWRCWGTLVELRVHVTRAYTGAVADLTLNVGGPFQSQTVHPDTLAQYNWAPIIDLTTAGERIVRPGSVTGAQAGDSLAVPAAVWLVGGILPTISGDTSGDSSEEQAIVEIELTTDQGIGTAGRRVRVRSA